MLGVVRPAQAEELVDGVARADRAVPGDGVAQPLPVQVGALADEESRLEQGDGADELRRVEREAERDDAAERVPDDVRAIDAEMREHPAAVGGLLRERQRPVRRIARSVAAAVVRDDPMAVGQATLGEQRPERVGEERAVDADDGVAGAGLLVGQPDAVDDRAVHRSRPIVCRAAGRVTAVRQ